MVVTKKRHINPDGSEGGLVENTAFVSPTAYIGYNVSIHDFVKILDESIINNNVKIYDHAIIRQRSKIENEAVIRGFAKISGDAKIYDNAYICGHAKISGQAEICDEALIYGNAKIYGKAILSGTTDISGQVEIYDYAYVCDSIIKGHVKIDGYTKSKDLRLGGFERIGECQPPKDKYIDYNISGIIDKLIVV